MDNIIDNLKKNKKTLIICIILIIIVSIAYHFLTYNPNDNLVYETEQNMFLKKYGVNEYIPVYITEEDMAKKYLNDYKNKMLNSPEDAYEVLNKEYREKRFGSLESFTEYLNEFIGSTNYDMEVDKYQIKNLGGYKYFDIYDNTGDHYIFKEISIMNYEVYLDGYTISIE